MQSIYLASLWQWMKRPFTLDVDDCLPRPEFASLHVKEERSGQPWQKWQMVKSLVSLLPFPSHFRLLPPFPLSSTPSSVVLWLTLYPLTAHSPYSLFLLLSTCTRVLRSVTWQWTSPSYGTAISSSTIPRRLKVPLPSITARPEGYKALNPQGIDGLSRSLQGFQTAWRESSQ